MKCCKLLILIMFPLILCAQTSKSLYDLQQEFLELRFGMLICLAPANYLETDWSDPDFSPSLFHPKKLDCKQWAKTAKAAKMKFGCLTAKHVDGFCLWDTKTTDHDVMSTPLKRDIVKEYAEAFRAEGLAVGLYFSILDIHHDIRPGMLNAEKAEMVKAQLTELFTNYGEISILILDSWEASWSRISYDIIPFEDIYYLVKSLQPNCVISDHNSDKYPSDVMYYSDIRTYEQNAGQQISKSTNRIPAVSSYPINPTWFWKEDYLRPENVKTANDLVNNHLIHFNNAYCNLMLGVTPNRDGLFDDIIVNTLTEVGKIWEPIDLPKLQAQEIPIVSSNIAKKKPSFSSWAEEVCISDFGNDDNYNTWWVSNKFVEKEPWYEVLLEKEQPFNAIIITEGVKNPAIKEYRIEYRVNNQWKLLLKGSDTRKSKIHRFDRTWGDKVRVTFENFDSPPTMAEFAIYNERR